MERLKALLRDFPRSQGKKSTKMFWVTWTLIGVCALIPIVALVCNTVVVLRG